MASPDPADLDARRIPVRPDPLGRVVPLPPRGCGHPAQAGRTGTCGRCAALTCAACGTVQGPARQARWEAGDLNLDAWRCCPMCGVPLCDSCDLAAVAHPRPGGGRCDGLPTLAQLARAVAGAELDLAMLRDLHALAQLREDDDDTGTVVIRAG
jgi:hypothetical protein